MTAISWVYLTIGCLVYETRRIQPDVARGNRGRGLLGDGQAYSGTRLVLFRTSLFPVFQKLPLASKT
jgi:hypothetical protein